MPPVYERPSTARSKKATQLYNAAREGDKVHVKQLILARADLEWQDFEKFTPLNIAAAHCFEGSGHVGCIRLLLEAGAERDAKTKGGKSALDWAQTRGHDSLIHLLEHPPCAAPATVYAAKPDPGFLLWDGANEGETDIVRELIASRASLEWKTIHGFTALHRAAAGGHSGIVRLLLREGANKDAVDVRSPARSEPESLDPARLWRHNVGVATRTLAEQRTSQLTCACACKHCAHVDARSHRPLDGLRSCAPRAHHRPVGTRSASDCCWRLAQTEKPPTRRARQRSTERASAPPLLSSPSSSRNGSGSGASGRP